MSLLSLALGCHPLREAGGPPGDDPAPGAVASAVFPCPADVEVFAERVWEPVLSPECAICHAPGGIGASSAFQLFPDDLSASMEATFAVSDRLVAKPTGQHPDGHGGGAVLAPGSAGAGALAFWVGWLGGDCEIPEPPSCEEREVPRLLRRLTHPEYARTIADLLGMSVDPETFASDPVVDGFRNDARALVVSDLLADRYRSTAEEIGQAANVAALVPCSVADGSAACASSFVESFGLRAFRRPLTQQDIDRYVSLWAEIAIEDGFEEGIRWVIVAMLQSPSFLYRSELGEGDGAGRFALTGWEAATALSYAIRGTTPDDGLLALAASGALDTPEGVASAASELLADGGALEAAADLVEAWLDTRPLSSVPRDDLGPDLRAEMRQETRDLVIDIARSGGSLTDLMTARHTFVDPELAEHYGLDGSGGVSLDGVRYGGLLTQASVLTTHGRPNGSGPVQRGVTIRERLLCEELPPPPSNLDVSPPPVDPELSTREQYLEHAVDPGCSGCHQRIDPLGFAFERYDELGRYREDDRGHPIDDSGHLDGLPFVGPFELADVLLGDPRFRSCFVRTWRRHVTGIEACADDPGPEVGLLAPLDGIPLLPGFRIRAGGPDEGDTLAAGARIVPGPREEPELPEGRLGFTFLLDSSWRGGACWDGVVTNATRGPVVWEVRAPADGHVEHIWDAEVERDGDEWVFRGDEDNEELASGEQTSFGLCADR